MTTFMIISMTLLLAAIVGLVVNSVSQRKQFEAQLEKQLQQQQDDWTVKYQVLKTNWNELKKNQASISKLKQDKEALIERMHSIESKKDSLSANLAALEVYENHPDRAELLEKENKILAAKVVKLHRNNTEIKLKLNSYLDYEAKQNQMP